MNTFYARLLCTELAYALKRDAGPTTRSRPSTGAVARTGAARREAA